MTDKQRAFVEFARYVLELHDTWDFEYPMKLAQNGPDSDIIALDFPTIEGARRWATHFKAADFTPQDHPVLPVVCVFTSARHHGWEIQISARERADAKV